MKRHLPAVCALLFLFVFVFSLAATILSDARAVPVRCGTCCYRPPRNGCSESWGQIYNRSCDCGVFAICAPTPCKFACPVCW